MKEILIMGWVLYTSWCHLRMLMLFLTSIIVRQSWCAARYHSKRNDENREPRAPLSHFLFPSCATARHFFSKWISGFLHRPVDKWNPITSPHLLIGCSDPVFPITIQKPRCNNFATLFFQQKSSSSSFRCDGKSDNYHIFCLI
jgi:hypothetical protein